MYLKFGFRGPSKGIVDDLALRAAVRRVTARGRSIPFTTLVTSMTCTATSCRSGMRPMVRGNWPTRQKLLRFGLALQGVADDRLGAAGDAGVLQRGCVAARPLRIFHAFRHRTSATAVGRCQPWVSLTGIRRRVGCDTESSANGPCKGIKRETAVLAYKPDASATGRHLRIVHTRTGDHQCVVGLGDCGPSI